MEEEIGLYSAGVQAENEARIKNAEADLYQKAIDRPNIVCLCGSTRFMDAFYEANRSESLKGHIVLTVAIATYDSNTNPQRVAPEQKRLLDELHLRKIDLADEVFVLNVDNYIGESTAKEIAYAAKLGKPIRYLVVSKSPILSDKKLTLNEE